MFSFEEIKPLQTHLNQHPVYSAITDIEDLRCFMSHHVYSVWDFMSIVKYLQQQIAPSTYPWTPKGDGSVRRFINELVLEEESDQTPDRNFSSHFELYCQAMIEVGANTTAPLSFISQVEEKGIKIALTNAEIPSASRQFMQTTFDFIFAEKPHCVAAALALGREHIIPQMFRAFLAKMNITEQQAPIFHFYLKRHIHLDEDFHAPLSLRLLNALCTNDPIKYQEANQAAKIALQARIAFWDGVLLALSK
ncbi:MAG: hypothetical protein RIT27_1527 [Pseudomonadota bacterium]|jgi:hypothetical protein